MNHYSNQLLLAEKIAKKAHEGQVDKAGKAYFDHVETVSRMGENINEQIVGYLHDVVEDSSMTIFDLKSYGFSNLILNAVETITRKDNESWNAYIKRVGENSLATKVKLNDLAHNSDLSRISQPTKVDIDRLEKYKKAITELEKRREKCMKIDHVVAAINDYQRKMGEEEGFQLDQLRYDEEFSADGDYYVTVESTAFDKEVLEFSIVIEEGKVSSINRM